MRKIKKLGVILSMAAAGSMMTAAPVSAKINVTSQIKNTTNFAVIVTNLTAERRQKYDKCRVTDPNRMNYNSIIRDYANKYVSLGYYVFDIKAMKREGVLPGMIEQKGLTDGIFVVDAYEKNTMVLYIASLSPEGYEKGFLGGRKAQKATDYSFTTHDTQLKYKYITDYTPSTRTVIYSVICDPGTNMNHI